MSDTPRNDETPEFRDPTAPIETNQTQEVPPIPSAPASPASPPAQPAPPGPPPNPYASAPGAGQPNPYGGQQYPTQGQVQGGYAGPPPPGAPPYGAPVYGAPGYGAPTYATPRSLSGNTIALLVVSGLTTLGCGFGIVALVFGIIAATKKDDPTASAKFTKWGWIAFGVGLALSVIAVGLVIAFAVTSGTTTYDSSY